MLRYSASRASRTSHLCGQHRLILVSLLCIKDARQLNTSPDLLESIPNQAWWTACYCLAWHSRTWRPVSYVFQYRMGTGMQVLGEYAVCTKVCVVRAGGPVHTQLIQLPASIYLLSVDIYQLFTIKPMFRLLSCSYCKYLAQAATFVKITSLLIV